MPKLYNCPFCGKALIRKEMQFHVGIPLCMRIRIQTTCTEKIPAIYKKLEIPVSPLYLEYFGEKNINHLLSRQFQRMTYGNLNTVPIKLEEYKKGEISPEEKWKTERTKFNQNQEELRIWFNKEYKKQQKEGLQK